MEQGAFLLKAFHQEFAKDKRSRQTEFWRGELAGWRNTVHSIYGAAVAQDIIDRARHQTNLPVSHCGEPTDDGYLGFDSAADF